MKELLESLVSRFEQPAFIVEDPISIPHGFDDPLDREIIGLYAALLAWGRRRTILNKMDELCRRMRYQPYRFVLGFHPEHDGTCLAGFRHRTFTQEDALALTRNLSLLLNRYGSLEEVFAAGITPEASDVGPGIEYFSRSVMEASPDTPHRLGKHLARPSSGSACKRLAMYLRWMVRPGPVDFGQWRRIRPDQLVLPLDVHSGRIARQLGLLKRPVNDWRAVQELTAVCRAYCPEDPARYDFAFFGAGVYGVSFGDTAPTTSGATSSPIWR